MCRLLHRSCGGPQSVTFTRLVFGVLVRSGVGAAVRFTFVTCAPFPFSMTVQAALYNGLPAVTLRLTYSLETVTANPGGSTILVSRLTAVAGETISALMVATVSCALNGGASTTRNALAISFLADATTMIDGSTLPFTADARQEHVILMVHLIPAS